MNVSVPQSRSLIDIMNNLSSAINCKSCSQTAGDFHLPCSHIVCQKCVSTSQEGTFSCPVCNVAFESTKELKPAHDIIKMKQVISDLRHALIRPATCFNFDTPINPVTIPLKPGPFQCQNCQARTATLSCVECEAYYCHSCYNLAHSNVVIGHHVSQRICFAGPCAHHPDKSTTSFCRDCMTLFCPDCDQPHAPCQHGALDSLEALEKAEAEDIPRVSGELAEVAGRTGGCKEAMQRVVLDHTGDLSSAHRSLHAHFTDLGGAVQRRKAEASNSMRAAADFLKRAGVSCSSGAISMTERVDEDAGRTGDPLGQYLRVHEALKQAATLRGIARHLLSIRASLRLPGMVDPPIYGLFAQQDPLKPGSLVEPLTTRGSTHGGKRGEVVGWQPTTPSKSRRKKGAEGEDAYLALVRWEDDPVHAALHRVRKKDLQPAQCKSAIAPLPVHFSSRVSEQDLQVRIKELREKASQAPAAGPQPNTVTAQHLKPGFTVELTPEAKQYWPRRQWSDVVRGVLHDVSGAPNGWVRVQWEREDGESSLHDYRVGFKGHFDLLYSEGRGGDTVMTPQTLDPLVPVTLEEEMLLPQFDAPDVPLLVAAGAPLWPKGTLNHTAADHTEVPTFAAAVGTPDAELVVMVPYTAYMQLARPVPVRGASPYTPEAKAVSRAITEKAFRMTHLHTSLRKEEEACDRMLAKAPPEERTKVEKALERQRRMCASLRWAQWPAGKPVMPVPAGTPFPLGAVQRGPNWKWKEQDIGRGYLIGPPNARGWARVIWADGSTNVYRATGKPDTIDMQYADLPPQQYPQVGPPLFGSVLCPGLAVVDRGTVDGADQPRCGVITSVISTEKVKVKWVWPASAAGTEDRELKGVGKGLWRLLNPVASNHPTEGAVGLGWHVPDSPPASAVWPGSVAEMRPDNHKVSVSLGADGRHVFSCGNRGIFELSWVDWETRR